MHEAMLLSFPLLYLLASASCLQMVESSIPELLDMAGDWINPNLPPSSQAHLNGNQRDLPTINNFWGSLGIAPEGSRPVDMFAINALELPPYTGCGAALPDVPCGCGRLLVNGKQVAANATRWLPNSAGRRSGLLDSVEGLKIETETRMQFEANTVLWQIGLMNDMTSKSTEAFELTLELSAMVRQLSTVGTWVFPAANAISQYKYTALTRPGSKGVSVVDIAKPTSHSKPASAAFVCLGSEADISIEAGKVPEANFKISAIPSKESIWFRVALTIADNVTSAEAMLDGIDASDAQFDKVYLAAFGQWEARWANVFDPSSNEFSGNLPSLAVSSAGGEDIERVYYMSVLTAVTQLRTNLPSVYKHVFVNGQGNLGGMGFGHGGSGIGGATSWWWDESLTSMMFALLEPAGRSATLQAWFNSDPTATGSNHYALDCFPPGTVSCSFPNSRQAASDGPVSGEEDSGPPTGFYCYNLWALFMTVSNHLRVNNDATFLKSKAGATNMTVEQALANVATFWKNYIIDGTYLVDFAWRMDGFSGTYKHVMPGCSQGNNVWMMREMARLYDVQKRGIDAQSMRDYADRMSNDTIFYMYEKGGGYFNLVYPPSGAGGKLTAHEYRHVVDFFSVTFGLCGGGQRTCDFDKHPGMREEIADWFRDECVTKTWVRATSPKTNCSRSWTLPDQEASRLAGTTDATANDEWPGYETCDAGRPDHGTTGSYPSWPAFALEALCYLENYNCSSAAEILASFAPNTHEGPFGQATYAPQLTTPPYTPLNDELSFKPIAGVTRYVAIEGGSFFDAVLRGFFGYHPPMQWPGGDAQQVLNAVLAGRTSPRGFTGTLSNLRTPLGLATIQAGPEGLTIKLQ